MADYSASNGVASGGQGNASGPQIPMSYQAYPPLVQSGGAPVVYIQPQPMQYQQTSGQPQPLYYFPAAPPPTSPVVYTTVTVSESSTPNQPLLSGMGGGITPDGQPHLSIKDRLIQRTYETHLSKWFDEAWHLFAEHWIVFVLFTVLFLGVNWIPYVGPILAFPLGVGYFLVGSLLLRQAGLGFKPSVMFHGFFYTLPIFGLTILISLVVCLGLIFLIIPGLYFAVVLSFSVPVYLEYHHEGLGVIDSMKVSWKVLRKQFWNIVALLLVQFLLVFVGLICFVIPALVTIPVASLMAVYAFRDIFGLNENRHIDHHCVCC